MPKKVDDETVYRATCQLLSETGYMSMTTKLLAERAGVNEVSVFRKYHTKAELVRAALRHAFAHAEIAQLSQSGDLKRDRIAIVETYLTVAVMWSDS